MKSNELDQADLQLLDLLQADASLNNLQLAQRLGWSAATCLRRVRRLHQLGLIERQVALLHPGRLAALCGQGLEAVVEVALERQGVEFLEAFEARAVAEPQVVQCYRTAPGPDFVLMVAVARMDDYQALAQRLFTQDANVRNVKAFFATKRAKFAPRWPLPGTGSA